MFQSLLIWMLLWKQIGLHQAKTIQKSFNPCWSGCCSGRCCKVTYSITTMSFQSLLIWMLLWKPTFFKKLMLWICVSILVDLDVALEVFEVVIRCNCFVVSILVDLDVALEETTVGSVPYNAELFQSLLIWMLLWKFLIVLTLCCNCFAFQSLLIWMLLWKRECPAAHRTFGLVSILVDLDVALEE